MAIRVTHSAFIGLTGHHYKKLDETYDHEVTIQEALPQ
ncbi:unnamed protein product, partial [marine sediment metagenome]